ncbi:TetR/AcrR family transcriptional regulator C-terminal ligand-binding domain-containing protein [Streptomyces sp. NPDC004752]
MIIEGLVGPTVRLLYEFITRGMERGEARPDAAKGYVHDAIPAMMMHRTEICGSEWSDRDIDVLIDQLMLPLLRPDSA